MDTRTFTLDQAAIKTGYTQDVRIMHRDYSLSVPRISSHARSSRISVSKGGTDHPGGAVGNTNGPLGRLSLTMEFRHGEPHEG
jgi:hypothetical protein